MVSIHDDRHVSETAEPLDGRTRLRNQLRRDYERDLRLRSNASLLEEREARCWQLAGMGADLERDPTSWDYGHNNVEFQRYRIAAIDEVIEERRRLRNRPEAPRWRQGNRNPFEATKAHADAIKRNCPIDVYCIVVGIDLTGRGDNLMGHCPFPDHPDRSPSFSVTPSVGLWHCFGCGRGGDIISLHEALNGLTFFDQVVADLGCMVHVAPPGSSDEFTTPSDYSPHSQSPRDREQRNNSGRRSGVRLIGGRVVAS